MSDILLIDILNLTERKITHSKIGLIRYIMG